MAITAEQAISALLAKGFFIEAQGGEIRLHNDADLGIIINPAKVTLEVGQCVPEPSGIARERLMGLELTYLLIDAAIDERGTLSLVSPLSIAFRMLNAHSKGLRPLAYSSEWLQHGYMLCS